MAFSRSRKSAFQFKILDDGFQLDQAVEKTDNRYFFSHSPVGFIGQKRKVERPAAYPYEYHTHKQHHDIRHNPTPQHRLRWLGCCHFCCCSARVSVIFIQSSLRPSAARTSTRWPQCVVSMIFRNCCAGYSFGDFSRNPAPP